MTIIENLMKMSGTDCPRRGQVIPGREQRTETGPLEGRRAVSTENHRKINGNGWQVILQGGGYPFQPANYSPRRCQLRAFLSKLVSYDDLVSLVAL